MNEIVSLKASFDSVIVQKKCNLLRIFFRFQFAVRHFRKSYYLRRSHFFPPKWSLLLFFIACVLEIFFLVVVLALESKPNCFLSYHCYQSGMKWRHSD